MKEVNMPSLLPSCTKSFLADRVSLRVFSRLNMISEEKLHLGVLSLKPYAKVPVKRTVSENSRMVRKPTCRRSPSAWLYTTVRSQGPKPTPIAGIS